MSAPPSTRTDALAATIARRSIAALRRLAVGCAPRRWRARFTRGRIPPASLIVLSGALLVRLALTVLGWPPADSDEATVGLMALHIAERGERPIFFYGQQYMGTLEAYLAAVSFHFFGPSVFALRLGGMLMALAALGVIYLLARRLYSPGLALLCLGLLALGPAEPLLRELWTGLGYTETLLFGSVMLLLATWLAQTQPASHDAVWSTRQRLLRLAAFAGWGLAAGLGLWSDLLVLPYVFASGLLLVACCLAGCWREWRAALPAAVVGLLAGGFPLLIYAFTAPSHNPFAGALSASQSSDAWRSNVPAQLAGQLVGTFSVALPDITGGAAICPVAQSQQWPLAHASPSVLGCTGIHALWGLGFAALLALALIQPARALWRGRRLGAHEALARPVFVREAARLALAGGAALGLLLFLASPVAARVPHLDSRYLLPMLIALPAVLAAPWRAAMLRLPAIAAAPRVWLARLVLGVIVAAYLLSFATVLGAIPAAHVESQQRAALVAHLEHAGVSRVYSEYWTCGWLIFLSQERIQCAALGPQLQPDLDRYPPYRAAVRSAPDAAYLFPVGSAQAAAFAAGIGPGAAGSRYTREVYAGYMIYRPVAAGGP